MRNLVKKCYKCTKTKPDAQFRLKKKWTKEGKQLRDSKCKECEKEYMKTWMQKHRSLKYTEKKVCRTCKKEKNTSEFYKSGAVSKGGVALYRYNCMDCHKRLYRESRHKSSEERLGPKVLRQLSPAAQEKKFWHAPGVLPEETDPRYVAFENLYEVLLKSMLPVQAMLMALEMTEDCLT
jgi:hypothetical protein